MESRIKQLREKRGLIQEILAAELGITQQMLSKYERDVTLIKVDILKKIATYFNVTTDYLLGVSDVKRDLMQMPNGALREQLEYDGSALPDSVYEQLATATEMYYRFDANLEQKKKAINILADILESEREEVKDIFNAEYEVPKNEHDKLIFGIVNGYNIRHNRAGQKSDYSKEIWYDWMMQYYTSVIIAFYKLKNKHNDIDF